MNAAKPLGEISEFGRKERIRMQQGRSVKILNLEDKSLEEKNPDMNASRSFSENSFGRQKFGRKEPGYECCKVVQWKFWIWKTKMKKGTTPLGIEPRISGSVDQRLIHWATESLLKQFIDSFKWSMQTHHTNLAHATQQLRFLDKWIRYKCASYQYLVV